MQQRSSVSCFLYQNNNCKIQLEILVFSLTCIFQKWFWLENKITENQWKIAETIYIPSFQNGPFLTCSDCVQQLSAISFQRKIDEISYKIKKNQGNDWKWYLQLVCYWFSWNSLNNQKSMSRYWKQSHPTMKGHNIEHQVTMMSTIQSSTVKPVLRGHLWDKEKVTL